MQREWDTDHEFLSNSSDFLLPSSRDTLVYIYNLEFGVSGDVSVEFEIGLVT